MKHLFSIVALFLGFTATYAQVNQNTLRDLENSSSTTKTQNVATTKSDTIKITDRNKVYTFIDSLSAKDGKNSNLVVRKNDNGQTLELTLWQSDSTNASKDDIIVGMENITITSDSVVYSDLDTAILRMGNRRIIFIHNNDKNVTTVEISNQLKDKDDDDYDVDIDDSYSSTDNNALTRKGNRHFYVGTLGLEFGINGFMDKDNSMSMSGDMAWLDLKQARSWNFNLYLWNHGFRFGSSNTGIVTGVGLAFNNYHFSKPVTLKLVNGITTIDSSFFDISVRRTKLSTFGIDVPLLLEFHIPVSKYKKINLSAGVIGQVRVTSKTKVVYDLNGDKHKQRNGSDFNMTTLKYMLTARLGYDDWYLFANYSPISLFEKDKGPEVYPFSIGFGFSW